MNLRGKLRWHLHVAIDNLKHIGQRCTRCNHRIHEDNTANPRTGVCECCEWEDNN